MVGIIIFGTMAFASAPLVAMSYPTKILAREALMDGQLEAASSFIQVLEKKGINPGDEIIGIIQKRNMGIPLALTAVINNHGLTLKFLSDHGFIKENDERLSKGFNYIAHKYFNINKTTSNHEKALIKKELYAYLKLATQINQKEVIDPNLSDDLYEGTHSLLLDAAHAGDTAIIALLIKLGADVNARIGSSTALVRACKMSDSKRRISVIKMLLEAGADPKIGMVDMPPIIAIIWKTKLTTDDEALADLATGIKLLLNYGASIDTETFIGRAALNTLKSKGDRLKDIIPLLEANRQTGMPQQLESNKRTKINNNKNGDK